MVHHLTSELPTLFRAVAPIYGLPLVGRLKVPQPLAQVRHTTAAELLLLLLLLRRRRRRRLPPPLLLLLRAARVFS